jgi:hypothetical protein
MSYKFNVFTGKLDIVGGGSSDGGLYRRDFTQETIVSVNTGFVLQMHSPVVDGELFIDGEVYIL